MMRLAITQSRWFHRWFWPAAGFAMVAIMVAVFGVTPLRIRETIVLHYSPVFGIDRVGPPAAGFVPAALALLTLSVNTALAARIQTKYPALAALMGILTVPLEAGFAVAAIMIVVLNR